MYSFNLEATTQILQETFNDTLMSYLISFGVSSISLNLKNDNLTLYPVILIHAVVHSIITGRHFENCPFPADTGHI